MGVGLAEQQRQQEVQAGALREGLMEIHGQRAALARLVDQWEQGKPYTPGAEPASSRSASQLSIIQLHLDTILGTVMERVEQRLDRELASTRDVVAEAVEAHVQHAGELAEDRAVWLAAEVRRLSAVVDAAPWTSQEAQDLDALQQEVKAVLRHSENVKSQQETLKQEVASCIHSSREALMGWNNCSLPSLATKLEALEATEKQHQTEVTVALQSLTQRVADLVAPMQGQLDAQQPKAHSKNQPGSTPVKPGKVLILEEANGNTPARAVVSLAMEESCASLPMTPMHNASADAILQRSGGS